MNGFYAYIIGTDGHVIKLVDLAFENQEDAEKRAKALVDGHDVELWQLDRKLATLKHSGSDALSQVRHVPMSNVGNGTDDTGPRS